MADINVLNNTEPPVVEKPKEQERINVSNIPPKSIGERELVGTLTNKRVTKRSPAVTQSATPVINTDVTDIAHITGLAQAITSMTFSLTGTPVEGDTLRIDITDNGTARAITWGDLFASSGNTALPTTTVLGVRLDVGFFWDTVATVWRCVAVS